MTQVKFSKETKFTGRNGYFRCTGVELLKMDHSDEVMISPLTGNGSVGRCDISVPIADIPKLVEQLQELICENYVIKQKMGMYLAQCELSDDEIIAALEKALEYRPDDDLESIEGISVWEKVEGSFTIKSFCENVGIS